MRWMAIDYGEKRVGVALSDPTATLATPFGTLQRRRGRRPPLRALEDIAREHDVGGLVVGLPLALSGEENAWCAEIRTVGDELGRRLELPVAYVDERLTSVQAEEAIRSSGRRLSQRREKGRVDAAAAAVILQRHLDAGEAR